MLALVLLACAGSQIEETDGTADTGDSKGETADPGDSDTSADDTGPPDSQGDSACDTALTHYLDRDRDGHGDPREEAECGTPFSISTTPDDCDDRHASVYEGAPERLQSGRDDDCDGRGAGASVRDAPMWEVSGAWEDGWPCDSMFGGLAMPGDVSGDGIPDLVITGYRCDSDAPVSSAWIFQGPIEPTDPPVAPSDAATALNGDEYVELSTLCALGDTDGDGSGDLLMGGQGNSGETVMYLARAPFPLGTTDLASTAQSWRTDYSGSLTECASPGDLDGDGAADIVFSDDAAGQADEYGEVYILSGAAPPSRQSDAGTVLRGVDEEKLGAALATTGDLDGDGTTDFAVTGNMSAEYLVLDARPGTYHPSDVGVTAYDDEKRTRSHNPLVPAPVGDVNHDGYADASFWEYGRPNQIVKLGPFTSGTTVDLQTEWDIALRSDNDGAEEAWLGISSPLGDWDGDGFDDLAVANKWYVPTESRGACGEYDVCNTGAVFLIAGPVRPGLYDMEVSADRLDDVGWTGTFGDALASGSDLNQDGFPDLLILNSPPVKALLVFGGGAW